MKPIPFFLLTGTLAFALVSCNAPSGEEQAEEEASVQNAEPNAMMSSGDNSRNALDWDGLYTGTLPCADCEGIKTMLQLNQDETYVLKTKYLGKSDEVFTTTGTFTWNAGGGTIRLAGLDGDAPGLYQVGENALFHLDKDGKRITGDLADKYRLNKARPGLVNTRWKLVEIRGKKVADMDLMKEPYIQLTGEAEGWKVAGNDGCNNLIGSYEMGDQGTISFGQFASTSMACPKPDLGQEISRVMEKVDNFSLNEDRTRLSFSRAKTAPLAVFEVDYIGGE
jgi:uncharacterized lipoprotein NlpE involved in copper resistance